ncbi:hypothetical protein [Nonomuraea wenchangensis]|uniref:hypothetical protein n=1 Tax=Nonomuraea wenchangensis TaxID=568860 RepID=UPI000B88BD34|nr:hypothetical protein [Nonomuraea wenchangensis]
MSDQQIPSEAIEAQRAYDLVDAEVQRLTALMPSSTAVAAGEAAVPRELQEEWEAARTARLDALAALLGHKRWDGDGGPIKAEAALRKAARAAQEA